MHTTYLTRVHTMRACGKPAYARLRRLVEGSLRRALADAQALPRVQKMLLKMSACFGARAYTTLHHMRNPCQTTYAPRAEWLEYVAGEPIYMSA